MTVSFSFLSFSIYYKSPFHKHRPGIVLARFFSRYFGLYLLKILKVITFLMVFKPSNTKFFILMLNGKPGKVKLQKQLVEKREKDATPT